MAEKGTIIVVDDNEEFRRIYGDRLRHAGYAVLEAGDGNEALAVIGEHTVDLVLTDIVMPNKDGFGLIETLRSDEKTKTIPIIVLSVLGNTEEVTRGLKLGASDYLIKGMYSPNDILGKVEKLLSGDGEKNLRKEYNVYLKDNHGDAVRLAEDMGFKKITECEACKKERVLTLIPDTTHEGWFEARFECEC